MTRALIAVIVVTAAIVVAFCSGAVAVPRRSRARRAFSSPWPTTARPASRTSVHRLVFGSSVKTEPIRGHLTATFTLRQATRAAAIRFAQQDDHLSAVRVNQKTLAPHVGTPRHDSAGHARVRRNSVEFDFIAATSAQPQRRLHVYALRPARASLAMPCFDQPSLKARWRLSLRCRPNGLPSPMAPRCSASQPARG